MNKTIRDVSPGTTIIGQLGFRDNSYNVIIERLNITGYDGGYGFDFYDLA